MHRRTHLAALAAAALAVVTVPGIASGQQPTQQTSRGDVAAAPSYSTLILAVNNTAANTEKLKGVTDLTAEKVVVVNVQEILQGNSVDSLTAAIEQRSSDLTTLRAALDANEIITAQIRATTPAAAAAAPNAAQPSPAVTPPAPPRDSQPAATPTTPAAQAGLTSADIVATEVTDDGRVIVYYWKK